MAPQDALSPRDFGEALGKLRAERGVTIEEIAERTKIPRGTLEAFERGSFGALPARVFARMFLRQVLHVLQEPADGWLRSFDGAFDRFESSSQPFPAASSRQPSSHRVWPWVAALVLVTGGFLLMFALHRAEDGRRDGTVPPTPEALLREALASPTPAPPTLAAPEPPPAPIPTVLIVRTGDRECWVEAVVDGGARSQRLMAPSSSWEIEAGGRPVDLVVGDAGGVEIEYLGQLKSPVGQPGEVVRLRLGVPPEP